MENTTHTLTIYDPNGSQLPLGIINPADATTSTIEPISTLEAEMLTHYETIIEQGEQTIIEVGKALSAINRGRLYRAEYSSFEEYCRAKWEFGRKRGYELMRAGQMAEELSGAGLHCLYCAIQGQGNERTGDREIVQFDPRVRSIKAVATRVS